MKIHLDTSALNRVFDDQAQPRIYLESSSILLILVWIENEHLQLVSSEALTYENTRNPYGERRLFVDAVLKKSGAFCRFDDRILNRAEEIEQKGIRGLDRGLDALHLACAERLEVDAFITCDDRILRRYQGSVHARNPVGFTMDFLEVQQNENS